MRLPPMLTTLILSAGVISLLVIPGCTKSKSASPTHTAAKKSDSNTKAGSDKSETPADTSVGFLKAKPTTCMYHQEAQGYFRCLAGADGQCFHFGESCAPAKQCMFDVSQGVAKTCGEIVAGQCRDFGAACETKDSCQYSAKEARYRECKQSKSGRCTEHGKLCLPTE